MSAGKLLKRSLICPEDPTAHISQVSAARSRGEVGGLCEKRHRDLVSKQLTCTALNSTVQVHKNMLNRREPDAL